MMHETEVRIGNPGSHQSWFTATARWDHLKSLVDAVKQRLWSSILIAFLLFLFVPITSALGQDADSLGKTRAQVERLVSKYMATNSIPGLSVAIIQDGQLQWAASFGMADLENFVPATSGTLFRLASVSKPLTAVAAMQLWERGKLDLDAPVQKYCPQFPQKEWPISTREVLGHLGGIRSYRNGYDSNDPEMTDVAHHFADPIQDGLKLFASDPLVAQPGTAFNYSTYGYTLVGCVIEGASGEKYADYVRNNVLVRAGMMSTQVDDRYAVILNRTRFYHKDSSGQVVNADYQDSSYKIPGGGWLSSAEDMARFEIAMLNDKLLSRKTRDIMWTPQKTSSGSPTGYGLGWFIDSEGHPNHEGGQQGAAAFIVIAPELRAGAVVLINRDGLDPTKFAGELLRTALSKP
jgi:serine beta-lactamase-like protein LACTB, mitochondrial